MGSVICKVAAHQLGDKTVGRIVGLKTLGDAEIVDEALRSDATLITIADDALAELASAEYDGKTIDFTVRGNFSSAKISATLKYVAPPGPQFIGDITSTDREGQSVPGKFDPMDHPTVAMGGERLTRDASTSLVFEVKRGGETAFTKDLTDSLDEALDAEGTLIAYVDGKLYELLQSDDDALQNGDIVTATFTNALGSTTATGEVYNLP